jgi:Protein of unknown function (DUF4232)
MASGRMLSHAKAAAVSISISVAFVGVPSGLSAGFGKGARSSGSAAREKSCRGRDLRANLGNTAAAGGTVSGYLKFTDVSPRACLLKGWPRFRAVSASGATAVARDVPGQTFGANITGPHAVQLRPGGHADIVFATADHTNSATPCDGGHGKLPIGSH